VAATAAALNVSPVSAGSACRLVQQRSSKLVAQYGIPHLPAGWTTGVDQASGATFYFNEQTGQSQWEAPQSSSASEQGGYAQELPAGWTTGFDQSCGTMYYCYEQTGHCQWEPPQQQEGSLQPHELPSAQQDPSSKTSWRVASIKGWGPRFGGKYTLRNGDEEVLGRYDIEGNKPTRPWVSREQCVVQVQEDGTATLESRGKTPTLAAVSGAWYVLQRGERIQISHGDHVSLDYNDPEGSVFACTADAAVAA